jgi:hypothetical protein
MYRMIPLPNHLSSELLELGHEHGWDLDAFFPGPFSGRVPARAR